MSPCLFSLPGLLPLFLGGSLMEKLGLPSVSAAVSLVMLKS